MKSNRRQFLKMSGVAAIAAQMSALGASNPPPTCPIKPPRLRVGDTVGLVNPAGFSDPEDIDYAKKALAQLGLKVKVGERALNRYGYLAGTDRDRADDLNAMFADTSVAAIVALRGGWGCNRILPMLKYELLQKNPKIVMGYSDITALLLAIYAKTGIVTFHGPVATSIWNPFSVEYVKRILFEGEAIALQSRERPIAIASGKARGVLMGGNLSVLAAMVGSAYLPDWKQAILFVEEIGEEVYRIDRMLAQLKLAGILEQIAGFIFGQCIDCEPEKPDESLSFMQVLSEYMQPLGIPALSGAAIGHVRDKMTVPVGVEVEIDSDRGTIQMLESAVA